MITWLVLLAILLTSSLAAQAQERGTCSYENDSCKRGCAMRKGERERCLQKCQMDLKECLATGTYAWRDSIQAPVTGLVRK